MRRKVPPIVYIAGVVLLVVVLVMGLGSSDNKSLAEGEVAAEGGDGAPKMMAMPVEVIKVAPKKQRMWKEFSGHLTAVDDVEVRPQVGGAITKVLFEESALVEAGAPLFVIDPRNYEAAVENAKASLAAAKSQASLAKVELDRAKKLVKNKFVSESRFDTNESTYKVALAEIESAKAQLAQAELDLEFAHVKAPISGRVSRAEITVGNVIEAGPNAPVLTRIVSVDRLYAEFDVDEQTYIQLARNARGGEAKMPVELSLSGDLEVVYRGEIHSFDNQLNSSTGTIRARGMFDNQDGVLVPGMYATVRLGGANEEEVLMVPEKAISTNQSQKYVYVINAENMVEYRQVTLGQLVGHDRVIASGIAEGELVMTNGLQRVRPGMPVSPQEKTTKPEEKISVDTPEVKS